MSSTDETSHYEQIHDDDESHYYSAIFKTLYLNGLDISGNACASYRKDFFIRIL